MSFWKLTSSSPSNRYDQNCQFENPQDEHLLSSKSTQRSRVEKDTFILIIFRDLLSIETSFIEQDSHDIRAEPIRLGFRPGPQVLPTRISSNRSFNFSNLPSYAKLKSLCTVKTAIIKREHFRVMVIED